jgi:hypothetical protein
MANSCKILDEISERVADGVSYTKSAGKKINITVLVHSNRVSRYYIN